MKVLLILPWDTTYRYKAAFLPSISYQPLTLSTLAALIPAQAHAKITLVDEGVQRFDYRREDYDVVGISIVTSSSKRGYALADYFHGRGSYVLIGGHHATLLPGEAAGHADTVFVGSGETTFPAFFRDFLAGRPRRLYRAGCVQPASIPIARRELMPRRGYLPQPTVIADCGCGNCCRYCVIHKFWGKNAKRPVGQVIDELRALGKKEILFLDPSPLCDREYISELFAAMEPLGISWAGLSTVEAAEDEELIERMRRSGCVGTLIGFESFHQQDLDALSKGKSRVNRYAAAVEKLHSKGMVVLGTFMVGLDNDTPEYLRELPDLIEETKIDLPRFAVLTPYPATPLYLELESEGRILTTDWSLYDSIHCVFSPVHFTAGELEEAHAALWKACYTPARILRRLRYAPQRRLTALVTNAGFHFYSGKLKKLLGGSE